MASYRHFAGDSSSHCSACNLRQAHAAAKEVCRWEETRLNESKYCVGEKLIDCLDWIELGRREDDVEGCDPQ